MDISGRLFGINRSLKNKDTKEVKRESKKGYNFPFNNGGGIQGINDSGIETFKGSPKYFLTKETIQNALDAKDKEKEGPVKVSFKLSEIEENRIPYIDDLRAIVDSCREYWQSQNDKKTVAFMEKAADGLSKNKIPVLEIADYNTTGLKGAKEDSNSCFANLVKSSGVSNKDDNAGGSFGIGKNAPFCCSDLRTVLYSTLDSEGIIAAQGVAKLVTHIRDGRRTQGMGFLGIEEEDKNTRDIVNRPFINEDAKEVLDPYFIRKEVGTSLFTLGYSLEDNWEMDIIKATVDFYMVAIQNGKLEVEVEDVIINKNTLGEVIEKYKDNWKNNLTLAYYKALTENPDENPKVHIVENEDFEGMGKIKLYIYTDSDLPKKVAYVRGAGMKIIDKDRIGVTVQFAGVLVFEGHEINKFIRSLENPSHDKIQIERHERKTHAEKIIKKLNKWIKESVMNLETFDESEALDAEGISQYLPDEVETGNMEASVKNNVNKSLSKAIKNAEIKKVNKPKKTVKKVKDIEVDDVASTGGHSDNPPKKGGGTGTSIGGIKNPGETKGDPNTNPNRNDDNIVPIEISRSRTFLRDRSKGVYRVIVKSSKKGNSYIQLRIIGEVGYEIAEINSVKTESGQVIKNTKKAFGPVSFNKNEERIFDVELNYKNTYSLEVVGNADHI